MIDKHQLTSIFDEYNKKYFENILYTPILSTSHFDDSSTLANFDPYIIEIAFNSKCDQFDDDKRLREVMLHEMMHLKLYQDYSDLKTYKLGTSIGVMEKMDHTEEFWQKLQELYDKEFGNGTKLVARQKELCI